MSEPFVDLRVGDARVVMKTLKEKSVQTIVTSPPYWGLRKYGGDQDQVWGGVTDCLHDWGPTQPAHHPGQVPDSKWTQNPEMVKGQTAGAGCFCQVCGAWKGGLGLEPTPQMFVEHLVEIFREVWRVLRDDGTVWLNLGDSYARAGGTDKKPSPTATVGNTRKTIETRGDRTQKVPGGLKSKDLVGIPWRVAFALQADGWYLRSDIVWAKPNPMPESVEDRPTRSHEYVFLLTKKADYYYDHEAVKEPNTPDMQRRAAKGHTRGAKGKLDASRQDGPTLRGEHAKVLTTGGRNRRSVWTITPKPYKGAHFATFPPELPEICLLAGTSERGGCLTCGAPFNRVIAKGAPLLDQQLACGSDGEGKYEGEATKDFDEHGAQDASAVKARILAGMVERKTIGWSPSCRCSLEIDPRVEPQIVMDIFNGSGRTGMMARKHGRSYIGIDLNPDYIDQAWENILGIDDGDAAPRRVPVVDKQSQTGNRTYTGFNARWKAKQEQEAQL